MASSFAVPNSSQTTQQHGRLYRILVNPWFLLAMITILILFLATQLLVPCDEAMWAYCSWLWSAHGVPPYVGSIENKSPGIFLLYRLSYALFGLSYMPPRLLDVAAVLGTMLLLYFLGKRYQGRFTGAMTAVIFGLMMTSERTDGSATAYTEVFLVFFTTLAFYLLTLECDGTSPRNRLGEPCYGSARRSARHRLQANRRPRCGCDDPGVSMPCSKGQGIVALGICLACFPSPAEFCS